MAATDIALFDMMAEKLYVAVVSDILDRLGLRNQVLQLGVVPAEDGAREDLRTGHLLAEVWSKYRVL